MSATSFETWTPASGSLSRGTNSISHAASSDLNLPWSARIWDRQTVRSKVFTFTDASLLQHRLRG